MASALQALHLLRMPSPTRGSQLNTCIRPAAFDLGHHTAIAVGLQTFLGAADGFAPCLFTFVSSLRTREKRRVGGVWPGVKQPPS